MRNETNGEINCTSRLPEYAGHGSRLAAGGGRRAEIAMRLADRFLLGLQEGWRRGRGLPQPSAETPSRMEATPGGPAPEPSSPLVHALAPTVLPRGAPSRLWTVLLTITFFIGAIIVASIVSAIALSIGLPAAGSWTVVAACFALVAYSIYRPHWSIRGYTPAGLRRVFSWIGGIFLVGLAVSALTNRTDTSAPPQRAKAAAGGLPLCLAKRFRSCRPRHVSMNLGQAMA